MRILSRLLLIALMLALPACDKATPTAPAGTVLTLSINPTDISLSGSATVTVTARKENGTPVNPGTQIRLSASLGLLDAEVLETDDAGVAVTALRGDGRIGTSEVIARSGAAESNMVTVQIGRLASNVSLQADPPNVDETGGTITLRAVVRDDQGQPLPEVPVNFQSDVGTLASGGGFVNTNSNGVAADTLTLTENDLLFVTGNTFTVTVEASASGGVQTADATITVQRRRASAISLQASPSNVPETLNSSITLQALVRDEQGGGLESVLVNFLSPVGDFSPDFFDETDADGVATVTLAVKAGDLQSQTSDSFTITAETSGTGGAVVATDTTITILRRPRANFSTSINRLTVSFQDTSTGQPTTWTWDFGDGTVIGPGQTRNPSHTYSDPGTFTVTLTVQNSVGMDQISRAITVTAQ